MQFVPPRVDQTILPAVLADSAARYAVSDVGARMTVAVAPTGFMNGGHGFLRSSDVGGWTR